MNACAGSNNASRPAQPGEETSNSFLDLEACAFVMASIGRFWPENQPHTERIMNASVLSLAMTPLLTSAHSTRRHVTSTRSTDIRCLNHTVRNIKGPYAKSPMAEPFSIAVGVFAVIQASAKTAQGFERAWRLRHRDQEFRELETQVTGLRLQLRAVHQCLTSIRGTTKDNQLFQDCLFDIEKLSEEAKALISEVNNFVDHVNQEGQAGNSKPGKREWMKNKVPLSRLTSRASNIMTSLIAAIQILYSCVPHVPADSLTTLTIQKIEVIQPQNSSPGFGESPPPRLDTKLEQAATTLLQPGAIFGASPDLSRSQRAVLEPHDSDPPCQGESQDETLMAQTIQSSLSRRSSIASFHSATSRFSDSFGSSSTLVSLQTRATTETCQGFCPCQCHMSSQMKSPDWAKFVFGSIKVHSNGSFLLNRRPCNVKSCGQCGTTTV
ncbi:hypothetical protein P154DRAFT_306320 [Amniculicola lignicola CBS 123094]|uniref:Fungal N-terminal domain-containing protein n=1 Tax=Amniculicola lignicola CBS 123094 TaxID=1392246 RepID=A0A6A5W4I8_9PLEO|nr:hypothetical protein P154DRAFT_306320 [Amniculicola lignicola CBS 123094]